MMSLWYLFLGTFNACSAVDSFVNKRYVFGTVSVMLALYMTIIMILYLIKWYFNRGDQ